MSPSLGVITALCAALCISASGCTTLPTTKHERYAFPKDVYAGEVARPFDKLGQVKTKVNYPTLDPSMDEDALCRNYYNKAARDLLKRARVNGADAVVEVRSVVFFGDGEQKTYTTPECADDGEEGQILLQGIAVKWKKAD